MNHKEIVRLSKRAYNDAKASDVRGNMKPYELWMVPFVLNLFAMAQQIEREACAKMVEEMGIEGYGTLDIAVAIREERLI